MAVFLHNDFIFVRHQTGEEWNKDKFLYFTMTDVGDKTASENRLFSYENDEIIVSHSTLDGPSGRHAVMLVRLVKGGKVLRAKTGITPLPVK